MGMAKKRYLKKGRNIEPAVMTMTFATPAPDPGQPYGGTWYIDLSQCASLVNRRFYRQGLCWSVAGIKLSSTSTGTVALNKIPVNWVSFNSWKKAQAMWNKQQKEALAEGGSQSAAAKFRDFKVYANTAHVSSGFAANLLPIDGAGNDFTPGEWQPSQIVLPNVNADASGSTVDPAERFLHMVGPNVFGALSRGIVEGYADSRAYPQSPDPVSPDMGDSDNWMARMFDVGNDMEEVLDNATDRNDNLPYPQVDYPGGETQAPGLENHDFSSIVSYGGAGLSIGTQYMKGGLFPAGLIEVTWDPQSDPQGNLVIQIDLVPGDHRGYLAEKMQDV